jgi:phosphoserine phosphatase
MSVDLVIQSPGLEAEAMHAVRVALGEPEVRQRPGAARFLDVRSSPQERKIIDALAKFWRCDAALVERRNTDSMRALVLDMDSTLITIECIDELARLAGKGEQVAAITEAAMRGEIADFTESLRRRVALLAGASAALIARVHSESMRLSLGAAELIGAARRRGWKTLLVTGGFTAFAQDVAREAGIDSVCANQLVIRDGVMTGEVLGPPHEPERIVDAAGKARALRRHCEAIGCKPAQAITVGDGANDLEMMAASGLSVAFRAKPRVKERASVALDYAGLDGIELLFADAW